jgi:Rrf2 family iron-sulfur cluster assembly transcriptional regulator
LWTDLSRQIFTFLEGITLAQFVERPTVCDVVHHQNSRRRDRSSERFIAPAMM